MIFGNFEDLKGPIPVPPLKVICYYSIPRRRAAVAREICKFDFEVALREARGDLALETPLLKAAGRVGGGGTFAVDGTVVEPADAVGGAVSSAM